MAFLIDTIDTSGLFAQSANSATIATKDSNGNDITATYQTIGDYYSASNPSGFITEVPDTYLQNTDLNITAGTVTGISGIPISASGTSEISSYDLSAGANINITKDDVNSAIGIEVTGLNVYQPSGDYYSASNPSGFISDLPASATEAIDAVTTYSGAWGGSALPISAGPGIKVNLVNNTLVFSNDETVLFDGNITATNSTGALSEPPSSFNDLRVEWYGENTTEYGLKCNYFHNDGFNFSGLACGGLAQVYDNYAMGFHFGMLNLTNDKVTLVRQARTNFTSGTIGAFTSGNGMFRLQRIIGINRISGDN